MSFNTKEQEIIKWGLQNKKSKEQVSQALTNFRLGITTQPTQPKETTFGDKFKTTLKEEQQKIDDINKSKETSLPTKILQNAAVVTGLPIKAVGDALPKPIMDSLKFISDKIGEGFKVGVDKLADTKLFTDIGNLEAQGYINKENAPEIYKLKDVLTGVSAGTEAVGNATMLYGGAKSLVNLADKTLTGVTSLVDKSSNAFNAIKNDTSGLYKKFTDKITSSKIDAKTQTLLKETPVEKLNKIIKQGEEALVDPRKLTPLEQTGNQVKQSLKLIKNDMATIGEQKASLLKSVGKIKTPNIAVEQINKVKALLQTKLTDAERSLVNQYIDELSKLGVNPTAASVDATIDKLFATLFEKSKGVAVPMTTRIKAAVNQSIGELNSKLKNAVDTALKSDAYSKINLSYSQRINLFNKLNKVLGEEGVKGGSVVKRFFSPSDAGIKELFKQIKDLYGIDLAQDATLARFVMETLGDTRAKSLLQLPATTPTGIVNQVLDFAEQKLTTPKKVFEKAKSISK